MPSVETLLPSLETQMPSDATQMSFYEIEFPLTGLDAEAVEAALRETGACSITFQDRGDDPVLEPRPGEVRLWPDTLVRALYDAATTDPAQNLSRLAAALGSRITAAARVSAVPAQAWERAWLKDWKSRQFGARLWVCPRAAAPPADPDAILVRLDPGLAFGTGSHPTTALCLETLAALDLTGKSVVDYGCGSGILAIAALKLGADHAICVDLDPQALLAARDNAVGNDVSARLVTQGPDAPLPAADCVLANILAGPLLELRPILTAACKPGGTLVLSGILENQQDALVAAYRPWFEWQAGVTRDDWACVRLLGS
jgi:ribosomal protein L11 methyltransferase